jgi:hypothetical protein
MKYRRFLQEKLACDSDKFSLTLGLAFTCNTCICVSYVFWQVFSTEDDQPVKETIHVYQSYISDDTLQIHSDNGILHVIFGRISMTRVYGIIYSASNIENMDGMYGI